MRTQFNIRLPKSHVERLDDMRSTRDLTQSEMVMSLIDTEWGREQTRGAKRGPLPIFPTDRMATLVADMSRYDLDELETAVQARRLELVAAELRERRMPVLTRLPGLHGPFGYLLVLAPRYLSSFSEEERRTIPPNVLADVAEARHLLDFLRELEPAEAYRRWHRTVAPLAEEQAAGWWYAGYMDAHSTRIALERVRAKQRAMYYGEGAVDQRGVLQDTTLANEEAALEDMLQGVTGA